MKINVITCLFIILISVQILVTLTLSVENKPSSSLVRNLGDHAAAAAMTVADTDPQEDGGKARAYHHEVKNMIVNSKKSQGKSGSGGGNNAVHGDNKKSAASTLPRIFYISVCFTMSLLVLSF